MSENGFALRLNGVTKRFANQVAVSNFDLAVPRGVTCGLLGLNGSGKTTIMRMVMGILHPDEGSVSVFGADAVETQRARIGYLPEERGVYRKMKCLDFILFLSEIRGMQKADGRRSALEWLERLELTDWADKKLEVLSRGMQQMIQLISAVIHKPELLILDEPFSGLDPMNQDTLEEIVLDLQRNGATVVFSTHLMDQAERLCERVCLISNSRKVLEGDLRELKAAETKGVVAIDFEGPDEWLRGADIVGTKESNGTTEVLLADGADHRELLKRGLQSGANIFRFELIEPRLHDIFVRHAGSGMVEDLAMSESGVSATI